MELLEIVVFDEADRQDSQHISERGHTILKATPEALGDGLPTRMLGGRMILMRLLILLFGVFGGPNVLTFIRRFRAIESRRMRNW